MTVIDASVLVDAFAVTGPSGDAARAVIKTVGTADTPHHIKAEVTSALRSMGHRNTIPPHRARSAVESVRRFPMRSHPIEPLLPRIWELRDTLTVYDAWYVALAERLNTTIYTADERLANASGPRCDITVI